MYVLLALRCFLLIILRRTLLEILITNVSVLQVLGSTILPTENSEIFSKQATTLRAKLEIAGVVDRYLLNCLDYNTTV